MQKLVTIAIDIEELKERSNAAFTVTEVEGMNAILEEGWMIQDWELITNQTEEEKAIVLLILNEEMTAENFEDSEFEETDESNEDEDSNEDMTEDEGQMDEQDQTARTAAQADISLN